METLKQEIQSVVLEHHEPKYRNVKNINNGKVNFELSKIQRKEQNQCFSIRISSSIKFLSIEHLVKEIKL